MFSNDSLGAKQNGEDLYKTETGQKATKWYNWADGDTPDAIPTTVEYKNSKHNGETVYYTNGQGSWTKTFKGKVSLMYLHDYYYSVSDEANCQWNASSYTICKTGWMHLSNNDTSVTSTGVSEWTMSRFGWNYQAGWFDGLYVNSAGYTSTTWTPYKLSVRPVFYLASVNELAGGSGKLDDPFIIK